MRSENCPCTSPQILIGASSSRSIGWDRKIQRDFKHNPRISDSVSLQSFPFESSNLLIIVSTSISSFCIQKKIEFKYIITLFLFTYFLSLFIIIERRHSIILIYYKQVIVKCNKYFYTQTLKLSPANLLQKIQGRELSLSIVYQFLQICKVSMIRTFLIIILCS